MAVRITQQRTEVIRQGGNTQNARATQFIIEQINQPNNLQNARMTQMIIEVITIAGASLSGGIAIGHLNLTY